MAEKINGFHWGPISPLLIEGPMSPLTIAEVWIFSWKPWRKRRVGRMPWWCSEQRGPRWDWMWWVGPRWCVHVLEGRLGDVGGGWNKQWHEQQQQQQPQRQQQQQQHGWVVKELGKGWELQLKQGLSLVCLVWRQYVLAMETKIAMEHGS